MAADYSGKVRFLSVTEDENESTKQLTQYLKKLTVPSEMRLVDRIGELFAPTNDGPDFILFRNGELVMKEMEANDKKLRAILDKCMSYTPYKAPEDGQVGEVWSEGDFDNCLKQSSGVVVLEIKKAFCRACKAFEPK